MSLSVETGIRIGARGSPLSQAQVIEVLDELRIHHPEIEFEVETLSTTGDLDQQTSLRALDKTDFFTKEIDELLLSGGCRIAIHSAKDLPDPLPQGIQIVAITQGVDPSDSLVCKSLKPGMIIATSSERREESVRQIIPDAHFCDLRGTIQQRLAVLDTGEVDGVVIAEAALIRLGLTHLNRVTLPGETASLQGKLAVLARIDDEPMQKLFSCIDTRTRCLYVGLELPTQPHDTLFTHYPVITTIPLNPDKALFSEPYTHIIFTSKTAVRNYFYFSSKVPIAIAVGQKTAEELRKYGVANILIAEDETAEGITRVLETITTGYFFWPHSSISRPIISSYLKQRELPFKECAIYDTKPFRPGPPPSLDAFDSILFTSPSTVKAFVQIFGKLPQNKQLKSIGPITQETIELLSVLH